MRSLREGQLRIRETMPLVLTPHEAKESLKRNGGRWSENEMRPESVMWTQPFSLSFVREGRKVGMEARESSSMLTSFREHFRERVLIELKREKREGREGEISERANKIRRCLEFESTWFQRLQTREQLLRSWQPSLPKTQPKHSSGNVSERSPLPPKEEEEEEEP